MENFTPDTAETVTVSSETTDTAVQEIPNLNGFKKLKGKLKVSDCGLFPVSKIKLGTNIRNEAKLVKSLPELLDSIVKNGINTPLEINPDGTLIDGFRRFACASKLQLTEVPVRVIDIPEDQIPFHQFLTFTARENIDESERGMAVFTYTLLNPNLAQVRIAEKFGVSTEFVSRASRVISKGETITKAVVSGVVSPTTAWSIVDNSNEKNFDHAENLLFDKLNALEDETDETKPVKPIKPVTLKTINNELLKAGLEPINKETKIKEKDESPKAFDKAKVIEFIGTLNGSIDGDIVNLTGAVSLEVWQYIQSIIATNKKFNCETIIVRDIEDLLDLYTEHTQNGECFIQVDSNEYISFNPLLAEYGLLLEVENQLERVKVSKHQLNGVISKIQMDVTVINQLKFQQPAQDQPKKKRTKKSKTVVTPELPVEVAEEFEADIQASILNSLDKLDNETEINQVIEPETVTVEETTTTDDEDSDSDFTNLIFEGVEIEPEFEDDLEIEVGF
jgi:ParB-like chromosome segregation protein Spo0J